MEDPGILGWGSIGLGEVRGGAFREREKVAFRGRRSRACRRAWGGWVAVKGLRRRATRACARWRARGAVPRGGGDCGGLAKQIAKHLGKWAGPEVP